jgi:hypothetical protein
MGNEKIKLTREELYQKVWSKPATLLAKDLGISDVAIAKICKKLNIPKPYSGYWRQVDVGHGVQSPLPEIRQGIPKDVVIYPNRVKIALQAQNPELLAKIELEKRPANHIAIAQNLLNAHHLVSQTKQILEKTRPRLGGILEKHPHQQCLDVGVSRTALNRALRILDALLKALEERGHSIEISNQGSNPTVFVIHGQKVKVSLVEKTSGKLTFIIDEHWSDGCRQRWSDTVRKTLEDQLNEVMIGVITAAEGLRQREIRWRKWEEEALRRRVEEQCRKSLEVQSDEWSKIQNIRLFLRSCEDLFLNRSESIAIDSIEAKWLAWAHRYVDRLDPLKNGDFEKMISLFAKLTDQSIIN